MMVSAKTLPPTISVIVPVFNEATGLLTLYKALCAVRLQISERLEFVFVDDGSVDESVEILLGLAEKDDTVQVIELSRNFGKEIAVSAGLRAARGDAAIIMDADMQHPPELIPEFIGKWRSGAEVVVGVRKRYGNAGLMKRFNSWMFYRMLNSMADFKVVPASTDYRLLDRCVIDEFNHFTERNRMTRGLIDWLGFKRDYVYFKAGERAAGVATYSFIKLIRLAINSFVGLSLFPLRLGGYLGIFITLVSSLLGLFIIVEKYMLHDPLNYHISFAFILLDINTFLIGIVLMSLGLVALYVANIHSEVINRPLYVVRRHYGGEGSGGAAVEGRKPAR